MKCQNSLNIEIAKDCAIFKCNFLCNLTTKDKAWASAYKSLQMKYFYTFKKGKTFHFIKKLKLLLKHQTTNYDNSNIHDILHVISCISCQMSAIFGYLNYTHFRKMRCQQHLKKEYWKEFYLEKQNWNSSIPELSYQNICLFECHKKKVGIPTLGILPNTQG